MLAIVSDIHSNLSALKAVLADMAGKGIDEIICLGDVVGYGPEPKACIELAQRHFRITLCGNHEWAILHEPLGFREVARRAVYWHRETLAPRWYSNKQTHNAWAFLQQLPMRYQRGQMLFVHASPHNPTEEYLLPTDLDPLTGDLSPKLVRAFDRTPWLCLVGHTHIPGVFTDDGRFLRPANLAGGLPIKQQQKYIINVGSVGQPRDGDKRACYATISKGLLRYHRVCYDVETTCRMIHLTHALDDSLGNRLMDGR